MLPIVFENIKVQSPKDKPKDIEHGLTVNDVKVQSAAAEDGLAVDDVQAVAKLIADAKRVLVLTGAGISVSSGIPLFRKSGGIVDSVAKKHGMSLREMSHISTFMKNPIPWIESMQRIVPRSGEPRSPSLTHKFIRHLEESGKLLWQYTQNIDGLESAAGIKHVTFCHGSCATATCMNNSCKHHLKDGSQVNDAIAQGKVSYCEKCKEGILKPDVVLFGEEIDLPDEALDEHLSSTDLLLVIGTSLKVAPCSTFPSLVRQFGDAPRILINPDLVGGEAEFEHFLQGSADAMVQKLMDILTQAEVARKQKAKPRSVKACASSKRKSGLPRPVPPKEKASASIGSRKRKVSALAESCRKQRAAASTAARPKKLSNIAKRMVSRKRCYDWDPSSKRFSIWVMCGGKKLIIGSCSRRSSEAEAKRKSIQASDLAAGKLRGCTDVACFRRLLGFNKHGTNSHSGTPPKGYYWNEPTQKWEIKVRALSGKLFSLGLVPSKAEAKQMGQHALQLAAGKLKHSTNVEDFRKAVGMQAKVPQYYTYNEFSKSYKISMCLEGRAMFHIGYVKKETEAKRMSHLIVKKFHKSKFNPRCSPDKLRAMIRKKLGWRVQDARLTKNKMLA